MDAQFELGVMYAEGVGVMEDDITALKWFTLSAKQGDVYAQVRLAKMYLSGDGVLVDYLRAYMWRNIAAYNGDESSQAAKLSLAKKMTNRQIVDAQALASRCLGSGYGDC